MYIGDWKGAIVEVTDVAFTTNATVGTAAG